MRKFNRAFAILTAVVLVISMALSVSAGTLDSQLKGLKFTTLGEYPSGTLEAKNARCMTATPDEKYVFLGALNGTVPTVGKFDTANGKLLGKYTFATEAGSFIKALASDDRGYIYCGIANPANSGAVYFSIVSADKLTEISNVKIEISGKVGVNGITVQKVGSTYKLYLMTNYDTDRIYCYDVTDVKNAKAVSTFGTNGYVDVAASLKVNEGNNIAVDSEGTIFLAAKMASGSKGDAMLKIKADGSAIITKVDIAEAYGCTLLDDQYIVGASYNKTASVVYILNKSDLSTVATYPVTDAANLTNAEFAGSKIYVCDQGFNGGDRILVSTKITIPVKPTTPSTSTGSTTAPATADNMFVVSAAMLALSAAVIIVVKKKH